MDIASTCDVTCVVQLTMLTPQSKAVTYMRQSVCLLNAVVSELETLWEHIICCL